MIKFSSARLMPSLPIRQQEGEYTLSCPLSSPFTPVFPSADCSLAPQLKLFCFFAQFSAYYVVLLLTSLSFISYLSVSFYSPVLFLSPCHFIVCTPNLPLHPICLYPFFYLSSKLNPMFLTGAQFPRTSLFFPLGCCVLPQTVVTVIFKKPSNLSNSQI